MSHQFKAKKLSLKESLLLVGPVLALAVFAFYLQRNAPVSKEEDAPSLQSKGKIAGGRLIDANAVSFSPDGKTLLVFMLDDFPNSLGKITKPFRGLEFVDIRTGKTKRGVAIQAEPLRSLFTEAAFSPDGKTLAVSEYKSISLWNTQTGKLNGLLVQAATSLAFSPDGKMLASSDSGNNSLCLWDVRTYKLRRKWSYRDEIGDIAFSTDGKRLQSSLGLVQDVRTAKIYRLPPRFDVTEEDLYGGSRPITCFSQDGKMAATAHPRNVIHEGGLKLWSTRSGQLMRLLEEGKGPKMGKTSATALAFSPDGRILGGAVDGRVKLWDVRSGQEKAVFPEQLPMLITSLTYSPNGKTLAIGGRGYTAVKLWRIK